MWFIMSHNGKRLVIEIDDAEWSLNKVKEMIAKKTDIPSSELKIIVSGKEINFDKDLPTEKGITIHCLDKRKINRNQANASATETTQDKNMQSDSLTSTGKKEQIQYTEYFDNFNIIPSEIFHIISSHLPSEIQGLIILSGVNKSLNLKIKEFIFEALKDEAFRKKVNEDISELSKKQINHEDFNSNLGIIEKEKIKYLFKNKTNLPIEDISVCSYADGKKMYRITTINYLDDDKNKDNAENFLIFLEKKQRSYLANKDTFRYMGIAGSEKIIFYISEHEMTILNDSSIAKNRPVVKAFGIREAIGKTTACLLEEEKTNDIPFIEFTGEGDDIKMVLRLKDNNYARELSYALQKEGYVFNENSNQSNRFNEFDIYPCEYYIDRRKEQKHRFITTSSI
ncbi:MAG: hypothetical protein KIT56_02180, partial [Gammaproteobacteria bacterium]|nr:hypothetical protein [Gammaproteobacteria bacterium]